MEGTSPDGHKNWTPVRDSPSARRGPKPAQVRLDRFAILHVIREHRLLAPESLTLFVLSLLVDWGTHRWVGTITDLATDMHVGRKVATTALTGLERAGLVAILSPFGPHRSGEIELLCYPRLVHLTAGNSAASVPELAANRVERHSPTNDDQRFHAETLRNQGAPKEQGADGSRATVWEAEDEPFGTSACSVCGGPANPASAAHGVDYCIECEIF